MERKKLLKKRPLTPISESKALGNFPDDSHMVVGKTASTRSTLTAKEQLAQQSLDFSTEGSGDSERVSGSVNNKKKPSNNPNGRPAGSLNKRTQQLLDKVLASGQSPMEYLLQEMRDTENAQDTRIDCANKVAPYIHAKLSSTEISGKDGKPIPIANMAVPVDPHEAAAYYKSLLG
jgi:hypothetical protein